MNHRQRHPSHGDHGQPSAWMGDWLRQFSVSLYREKVEE